MNCTMIMNTMGAMSNRFVNGESIMELDIIHKYNYFFCIYALNLGLSYPPFHTIM
jgi:hypothetical protein